MYHFAFHFVFQFLPPKVQAVVMSAIGLPIMLLAAAMIPGTVAGAVHVDGTMIVDLIIVIIPLLVVGGGLLIWCTLAMRPHGWRCMAGVLLIILGALATLAFLFIPVHELSITSWPRSVSPEAARLAEVLRCLCGPGVMFAGLVLAVIQAKQGARPAHLHDHNLPLA